MDEQNGKRRKKGILMCDGTGQHQTIVFEGLGLGDCPLCQLRGRLEALRRKLGAEYKPVARTTKPKGV